MALNKYLQFRRPAGAYANRLLKKVFSHFTPFIHEVYRIFLTFASRYSY
jgi:hypothetical protein